MAWYWGKEIKMMVSLSVCACSADILKPNQAQSADFNLIAWLETLLSGNRRSTWTGQPRGPSEYKSFWFRDWKHLIAIKVPEKPRNLCVLSSLRPRVE